MKVTFLGTGTSQGVPVIGCSCHVCTSKDPRDKRLRCSLFIEVDGTKIIVDSGPDFRQQLLTNNITDIDAIIYTHEHKDHIAGLDDVRPINYLQQKNISLYAEQRVLETIKTEFHYAFSNMQYPGLPKLDLHTIENKIFRIGPVEIEPIRVYHHKLPVFGFRINDFVYITDANRIEPEELEKCSSARLFVINSLRYKKHISHYTFNQALEVIATIQPKQAYLTHISHLLDTHKTVMKQLPENIALAYDGLSLNL